MADTTTVTTTDLAAGAASQQAAPPAASASTTASNGAPTAVTNQQPPPAPTTASSASRATRALKDNEDPTADDREIAMTPAQLNRRLERAKQSVLRDLGVESPDQLRERLNKTAEFERAQEVARQATLTREQQLEEARLAAEARAVEAEARAQQVEEQHAIEQEEQRIHRIADEFVNAKYYGAATYDYAQYLVEKYTPAELEKLSLSDDDVKSWFADYIKDRPEISKTPPTAAPPPVRVAPLTTGNPGGGARPDREAPTVATEKTVKPGQPNSMTKAELAQWKRQNGFRW